MTCSRCKTTEGRMTRYARRGDREYHMCNPCNTARLRKYRATSTGKAAIRRAVINYEQKNLTRRRAWGRARLLPLQPCQECGSTAHVDRHHDDPANALDVMFLCKIHHKDRHRELKVINAEN